MFVDKLNEFADGVSATISSTEAQIGDVLDLTATPQNIGNGEPVYLVFVTEATPTGTAGSVTITLSTKASSTVTSGTVLGSITVASGKLSSAGKPIVVCQLPNTDAYLRYLGVTATGTQTYSDGKYSAFLTHDPAQWDAKPDGL